MPDLEVAFTVDQDSVADAVQDCMNSTEKPIIHPETVAIDCLKALYTSSTINSFDKALDFTDTVGRRAVLLGDIDLDTGIAISNIIRFWNLVDDNNQVPAEQRQPIILYIDSSGGYLTSAFTIVDAIETSITPVYTINIGKEYSGGFLAGVAGHKHFGYKHSSFLFHEGSTGIDGDANKFQNYADFYKIQRGQMKDIILNHTNIPEDKYDSHVKDDWWMSAEDALEYGVIDAIITSDSDIK